MCAKTMMGTMTDRPRGRARGGGAAAPSRASPASRAHWEHVPSIRPSIASRAIVMVTCTATCSSSSRQDRGTTNAAKRRA